METIRVASFSDVPDDFTGIAEHTDGTKFWYSGGRFHRVEAAAREYPDGSKEWYLEGKRHREDGPAVEPAAKDGTKRWFYCGEECEDLGEVQELCAIRRSNPNQ